MNATISHNGTTCNLHQAETPDAFFCDASDIALEVGLFPKTMTLTLPNTRTTTTVHLRTADEVAARYTDAGHTHRVTIFND